MSEFEYLTNCVAGDPELTSVEKQLTINASYSESTLRLSAEIPCVVRGLLQNDLFTPLSFTVSKSDDTVKTVNADELDVTDDAEIYGVRGELPISVLSISSVGRNNDNFSGIVSTYN